MEGASRSNGSGALPAPPCGDRGGIRTRGSAGSKPQPLLSVMGVGGRTLRIAVSVGGRRVFLLSSAAAPRGESGRPLPPAGGGVSRSRCGPWVWAAVVVAPVVAHVSLGRRGGDDPRHRREGPISARCDSAPTR